MRETSFDGIYRSWIYFDCKQRLIVVLLTCRSYDECKVYIDIEYSVTLTTISCARLYAVYVADKYPCSSCKEILEHAIRPLSGEYSIKTIRGKTLEKVSSLSLSCAVVITPCNMFLETSLTTTNKISSKQPKSYLLLTFRPLSEAFIRRSWY